MWRKLMRTWLLGAAASAALHGPETAAEAGERRVRFDGEPPLEELLADPVCQALMRRDGITPASFLERRPMLADEQEKDPTRLYRSGMRQI
jgi:hypothetical protein